MSSTAGCWGCKPSFTTSFVFFFEHLKQSHGATTELTKLSTNNRTGCPLKCHLKRANFPQYYWQCHLLLWRHVHSEGQIHGFISTRLAKMMRRVFFWNILCHHESFSIGHWLYGSALGWGGGVNWCHEFLNVMNDQNCFLHLLWRSLTKVWVLDWRWRERGGWQTFVENQCESTMFFTWLIVWAPHRIWENM